MAGPAQPLLPQNSFVLLGYSDRLTQHNSFNAGTKSTFNFIDSPSTESSEPGSDDSSCSVTQKLHDVELEFDDEIPAHDQLEKLHVKIANAIRQNQSVSKVTWKCLGMRTTDEKAISNALNTCKKLTQNYCIYPGENPGIFFLFEQKIQGVIDTYAKAQTLQKNIISGTFKPFAVFKVGRKRAAQELIARKIANKFGLDKYIASGMFSALQYTRIPGHWRCSQKLIEGEERIQDYRVEEELWDLRIKQISNDSKLGYLVGSLNEFIPKPKEKASGRDLLGFTLLAMIIGLRDGKKENLIGSTIIDADECFPCRFMPSSEMKSAKVATQLPVIFEDEGFKEELSLKHLQWALNKINSVDLNQLCEQLQAVKKPYQDSYVETEFENTAEDGEMDEEIDEQICFQSDNKLNEIIDEGSNLCFVDKYKPDANDLFIPNNSEYIFNDGQISALKQRVKKLKTVLESTLENDQSLSCFELVERVDLFFAHQNKTTRVRSSSEIGGIDFEVPADESWVNHNESPPPVFVGKIAP